MDDNQTERHENRGGKREGAGRKGLASLIKLDPRYLVARGYNPLFATEVLERVIDERRAWQRVFQSEDDRIVLDALKFLVQMRDGKPSQSISVTSTNVNLNARDIETARAIVREIRGEAAQLPRPQAPQAVSSAPHQLSDCNDSPLGADVIPPKELV